MQLLFEMLLCLSPVLTGTLQIVTWSSKTSYIHCQHFQVSVDYSIDSLTHMISFQYILLYLKATLSVLFTLEFDYPGILIWQLPFTPIYRIHFGDKRFISSTIPSILTTGYIQYTLQSLAIAIWWLHVSVPEGVSILIMWFRTN
jgi:hypothetical protein